MWVVKGILLGILLCIFVYVIISLAELLCYDGYIKKRFFVIPMIIIFAACVICGVRMQSTDMWVDFYNDDGQIVETYEIKDYDTRKYGDSIAFYLKDGRTIVRKDCIYKIRFEEEDLK